MRFPTSKNKILLGFILLIFFITRLYKISDIPPSVYWDEASIGYNAYSITQTGKDEWGDFLPIHFRAFGEFKLPVFIYSSAIFIKLFGLSEVSVRIPAVLFSLGVVVVIYLLSRKIFESSFLGLLSSFFVTISPWFFIFSRTGYEVTVGLMFYLLAIYLFLFIKKNSWYIFFSVLCFALSAYSYNSFRIIIPLTILFLIVSQFKNAPFFSKKFIVPIILSAVILTLSVIPILRLYIYDAGGARFQAVKETSVESFVKNYLSHFSLDFLLINGDKNLRSQQLGFGEIYFPMLILWLLGFIYISREPRKGILILILMLIGPLSAAITKESPHALRAISMFPFLNIISALGVVQLTKYFKAKYLVEVGVVVIMLIFFINYFFNFVKFYPVYASGDWQLGYKKIFTDYKYHFSDVNQVIISDEYAQPYIFALYYLKYDPSIFVSNAVKNDVSNWGFSTVSGFDKFKFGKIKDLVNSNTKNTLIFASKNEKIEGEVPVEEVKLLNNETAFWLYKK